MYPYKVYELRMAPSAESSVPTINLHIALPYVKKFVEHVSRIGPWYHEEIRRTDSTFPNFTLTDESVGFGGCARVSCEKVLKLSFPLSLETAGVVCQSLRLFLDVLDGLFEHVAGESHQQPIVLTTTCQPGDYEVEGALSGMFRGYFMSDRLMQVAISMQEVWCSLHADLSGHSGYCSLETTDECLTFICPGTDAAMLRVCHGELLSCSVVTYGVELPAEQLTLLSGLIMAVTMMEGSI